MSSSPPSHVTCWTRCLPPIPNHRFLRHANSIIRASIEKGSPCQALLRFHSFLFSAHFRPDHRTFSLVLAACLKASDLNAAGTTHARIVKIGFLHSHASVATSLFQFYINQDRLMDARPLLEGMLDQKCDSLYGNLMLMRLLKKEELEEAYRVFKKMPLRDVVSWNSMIAGCVRSGRPNEAIGLFERMVGSGLEPDGFSFSSILSACARVGARSHGRRVHQMMVDKKVELNYILCSALVDMYGKCGSIDAAKKVFDGIARSHVSIWNSMMTGLAIHGLGLDALEMFSRMEVEGVQPDGVTFLAVLTACSHCGMLEEARNCFRMMGERYMIEPRIEHYGAIADALARAGLINECYETICTMPVKPDTVIWRVLLSACKRHQRPDLGEVAISHMERHGSGDYVLLSGIYSSARKWTSAEGVWDVMKNNKVRKKRGLSWVELGGKIHQFKAGDRSHHETEEIYQVLDALVRRTKAEGFIPMTELVAMDVLEEEREENLVFHSEKLAVAYSILKTGPGTEIMVSKNLRTCEDCHEWLKMISKVLCRVIVVRDRVRFHLFKNGACSCNDYW